MRASMVSRPTFSARMTKLPVRFIVPPMTLCARCFRHRHGFACHHGFIDAAAAVFDDAVDGHFFAGTDAETIAGQKRFYRHVFVGAVGAHAAGLFGLQIHQRTDSAACRLTRPSVPGLGRAGPRR